VFRKVWGIELAQLRAKTLSYANPMIEEEEKSPALKGGASR
jgi:hypothetical protein